MATPVLTALLDSEGVDYELIPHMHTERASDEADALGLPLDTVAKTVVVAVPDGYVRAMVPAAERLDLHKVRELLGAGSKKVHLASEADLAVTSSSNSARFRRGRAPRPVFLDGRLSELGEHVFEAGTHDESGRLRLDDLRRLGDVRVVDICED
jgi:Ala-tRNA(Pro) deacylase